MRRRLFWLLLLTAAAAATVAYRMRERARGAVRHDPWTTHEHADPATSVGTTTRTTPVEEAPAEAPPMVVATMETAVGYEGNGSSGEPAPSAHPSPADAPGVAFGAPVSAPASSLPEPARKRRLSSATLAVLGMVAGLGAIALGAWGVASSVSDDKGSSTTTPALANVSQVVSLISKPTTATIPLQGSGRRIILVVGARGYGVLVLNDVGQPPAGKTYEAWVIKPSVKAPQPAGLFSGGTKVVKLTAPVPSGAVVAITVEKAGGVPAPTQKPKLLATRA
jgi:hypothetical protein